MRVWIFVALILLPFAAAHAQSSVEDFCAGLEGSDTITVSGDFTSEELQAQLFVTAGMNSLQAAPEVAIGMFNEAINVADEYADAYLGRGCAYILQGDTGNAQADFEEFIQLTEDTALAETIAGFISGTSGTTGDECAMVIRDPATFASPEDAQTFIDGFSGTGSKNPDFGGRAEAYLCLGEFDAALDDLATAISREPNSPEYYSLRGIVYRRLGEYELAIADYDTALGIDPDYVDALNGRAYSSYLMGDYDQCIEDYDHSIALFDEDYIAFGNRGLCYDGLGEFETAVENYNQALDIAPDNAIVLGNRAVAYRLMGEYDLALEDNNRAIELDPNDPFYFVERGLVNYELGEYRTAVEDFTAAAELDPTYADAWLNLGDAQRELKDNAAAAESYQRYLELYPDSPYAEELQEFIDGQ
jgi:tetratricopeptide (TPR) repeat protein